MRETILFCFALFACSFELIAAPCQEKPQSWTDGTAKQRLKDIFEKGAFGCSEVYGQMVDRQHWIFDPATQSENETSWFRFTLMLGRGNEQTPPPPEQKRNASRLVSPDGKQRLEFRNRDLFVVNVSSRQSTQLTSRDRDRDVWFRNPKWSPDGKHNCIY